MTLPFVASLIAWFAAVVSLGIGAARVADRRPRVAFGMLMGALFVMLWGLWLIMGT